MSEQKTHILLRNGNPQSNPMSVALQGQEVILCPAGGLQEFPEGWRQLGRDTSLSTAGAIQSLRYRESR